MNGPLYLYTVVAEHTVAKWGHGPTYIFKTNKIFVLK